MIRILVVEDDADLNAFVCRSLKKAGYEAVSFFNGADALEYLRAEKISLILTDVMMPRMDGFTLAENVRMTDRELPIVFMTAKDDKPSKLRGYGVGVDDYVTKPFDMDVLLAKISAILRRAKIEAENELCIGNFVMNAEERTATVDGEEIPLTVREFDLLFRLLSYPKKTFTRSALMEEFWGYDSSATSRTVDVYVAKLREKTEKADAFEIVTVHGFGYKAVLK
ncbi:MAG: response regulator transcription factor [Clostridia bacterium]|nr:response regulator transcription factor [Clostridia bacterium]